MAIEIYSEYEPHTWQIKMHSTPWKWASLVGGKGGGKTRGAIEEIKTCALEFPGSAWLIGRKTLPSLKDSTWREFMEGLQPELIKDYNKAERLVTLHNDSYFIGRPLDDMKKFESIKLAGFLLDEADEIEEDIFKTLQTRVRQMLGPPGARYSPRYRGILVLNPCEEDHWIPQKFHHQKLKDYAEFFCTTMDNAANLPADYVDQLKATYSPDMQQRMIFGMYGRVHKGKPVFPQFSRGTFIRVFDPDPTYPVYRLFDFGFHRPACVWVQFVNGQVRVVASKLGKDIYLDDFLKHHIFPLEKNLFPDPVDPQTPKWVWKCFCDPAGSQESDKGKSSVEILQEAGIFPVYRKTKIDEGIKAIKHFLDSVVGERDPAFIIHPRCATLIEGFRGGYHRGDGDDYPVKDGTYDHEMDALRYGVVALFKRKRFGEAQASFDNRPVFVNPHTGRTVEI